MKKTMKKSFVMFMAIIMIMTVTMICASAEGTVLDVSQFKRVTLMDGNKYSLDSGEVQSYSGTLTITGSREYTKYESDSDDLGVVYVQSGTHNVIADNLTIITTYRNSPIHVSEGAALNLTVVGNNHFENTHGTLGPSTPAVQVEYGSTFTVTADSTGVLEAYGGYGQPGIGAAFVYINDFEPQGANLFGDINILGGTVIASTKFNTNLDGVSKTGCGAGIGMPYGPDKLQSGAAPSNIIISDATVYAEGGDNSAGIGGGCYNAGKGKEHTINVIISNSTVKAVGDYAGIGAFNETVNFVTEKSNICTVAEDAYYNFESTPKDKSGNTLSNCTVLTLEGIKKDIPVTKVTGASGYESINLRTIDGKFYIYSTSAISPTEVIAYGKTYSGAVTNNAGTFSYNHTHDYPAATCTEDGCCTLCLQAIEPALGHKFETYVYDNNETCVADGTETADCERCDATDTRTVAGTMNKDQHRNKEVLSENKATCSSNLVQHWMCRDCLNYGDEEIPGTKLDHVWKEYRYQDDATCIKDGTERAYCVNYGVCGAYDTRTVVGSKENGRHSFTNYIGDNNVSCNKYGTKTATCDWCKTKTDTVTDYDTVLLPHTFTAYNNVYREATCVEDKMVYAICDVCKSRNDYKTIPNSKLPHTYTTDTMVCGDEGHVFYCSTCDSYPNESLTAHDSKGEVTYFPAEKDGKLYYVKRTCCSVCSGTVDEFSETPFTGQEPVGCDHMCHEGGFKGFIWKIVLFFQKLFKIGRVCECGIYHW